MIGLVDADILTYQIGFGAEGDSEKSALNTLDGFICDLMLFDLPDVFEFEFFITGRTPPNYRETIAVTQPYKGNRTGTKKPEHINALRDRLVDYWGAEVAKGEEADDLISKRMTELGDDCICISIDKDLDTVAGWHYNFRKNLRYYQDEEAALYFFYHQLLTGDRVDNIKGVHGIGAKKADKILDNTDGTEIGYWEACVDAHGSRERAIEDATLLHMRRKDNEIWLPPDER